MKEWKRGDLHSGTGKKGKKGPVVKSQDQAIAIALNTCNNNEMEDRQKMKSNLMQMGYSESAAEAMAKETFPMDFSEDITPMVMGRLKVIIGRCQDIMQAVQEAHMAAKMTNGEVEMEQWMVDKMTLAADYLSAVADGVKYGDYGIEVDYKEKTPKAFESGGYGKGLSEKQQDRAAASAKKAMKAEKEGKGLKEQYKPWDTDKEHNKKLKEQGRKTPKSKHTKKYEDMYGKDSVDSAEDSADFAKKGGAAKSLAKKAKKTGISAGILRQVYQRGIGAWKTGHRPGMSPQAWAMARVNSFITGGGARKADSDLWKKHQGRKK